MIRKFMSFSPIILLFFFIFLKVVALFSCGGSNSASLYELWLHSSKVLDTTTRCSDPAKEL